MKDNVQMNDLEIIGLEGMPEVECSRSSAIVRNRSDQAFAKVSTNGEIHQWHPPEYLEDLIREQRITRFEEAFSIPQSVINGNELSPLIIVYITNAFISDAKIHPPASWKQEGIEWHPLDCGADALGACLSLETAEQLLDDWAETLIKQIDEYLKDNAGDYSEELERLADLGLCAGVSTSLRWRLYLRYGVSLPPDRVRGMFDLFIHPEFPDCSWQDYVEQMNSLRDMIKVSAKSMQSSGASQHKETYKNIAKGKPEPILNLSIALAG